MIRRPPRSTRTDTLFPYTTLFRSMRRKLTVAGLDPNPRTYIEHRILTPIGVKIGSWRNGPDGAPLMPQGLVLAADEWARIGEFVRSGGTLNGDRKSTRLNSSH